MVNFDRRELLRVKGEHFAIRKFLWVKTSFPLFVGVSGSSHEKFAGVRHAHLRGLEFNHMLWTLEKNFATGLANDRLPPLPFADLIRLIHGPIATVATMACSQLLYYYGAPF